MTIGNIIRATLDKSPLQFINECVLNATAVKKKKDAPAHTRITFATQHMTPNDLAWLCRLPNRERPQYVGVILWIPAADYEALANRDDPPENVIEIDEDGHVSEPIQGPIREP